jgi:hypothetical protein
MKKTNIFIALICLLATLQLSAQCRLVRTELSDTSETQYYYYDKMGRLSSVKYEGFYEAKPFKTVLNFAYNNKDKVVSAEVFYDDTLFNVKNYLYEGDVMKQVFFISPQDSVLETGQLFYNPQGQLSHFFSKKTNGDTFSIHYEYAPEGWMKRATQKSNKLGSSFIKEIDWDVNQRIKDEPSNVFFAGYAISPMNYAVMPIEPLSVKGSLKSLTHYNIDKEGKPIKSYGGEVFDIKGNAEGLWTENKFRNMMTNKVITAYAVYEGCKNCPPQYKIQFFHF